MLSQPPVNITTQTTTTSSLFIKSTAPSTEEMILLSVLPKNSTSFPYQMPTPYHKLMLPDSENEFPLPLPMLPESNDLFVP
jgi:hypothetical protein